MSLPILERPLDHALWQVEEHLRHVRRLLGAVEAFAIASVVTALQSARIRKANVFVLGNGGSTATAMHLCNDLISISPTEGPRLRVECLGTNLSVLTAIANDLGYREVFVEQLRGRVRAGDVVLALSGSGDSANCVAALEYAREQRAVTVGIVGFDGGKMLPLCDVSVHVSHHEYYAVEDLHSVICHAIARGVRQGPIARGGHEE